MEEATDGKWKEEKEKVSINLSRVKIWYGHVRDDEDMRPCRLKPSFAPFVLEHEVGNEAGDRGTRDGGGGGSGGNGVWLVLLFVASSFREWPRRQSLGEWTPQAMWWSHQW